MHSQCTPSSLDEQPDAALQFEFLDDAYATYRGSGVEPAMRKFGAAVGLGDLAQSPRSVELPPRVADMLSRIQGNQRFWLEQELRRYTRTVPDLSALRAAATQPVLAGGLESRDYFPYRASTAHESPGPRGSRSGDGSVARSTAEDVASRPP